MMVSGVFDRSEDKTRMPLAKTILKQGLQAFFDLLIGSKSIVIFPKNDSEAIPVNLPKLKSAKSVQAAFYR